MGVISGRGVDVLVSLFENNSGEDLCLTVLHDEGRIKGAFAPGVEGSVESFWWQGNSWV